MIHNLERHLKNQTQRQNNIESKAQTGTARESGFSLIELMVVVAIIAVLATIAIPRVNRFVAKSRTTEAQINLSSIYTFNKNFYVEYQGYTNAFQPMGYVPEGRLRYNMGWSDAAACPAGYNAVRNDCNAAVTNTETFCGTLAAGAAAGGVAGNQCDIVPGPGDVVNPIQGSSRTDSTFDAIATADLVAGDTDVWRINQDKNLENISDGTDGN